MSIAKQCYFCRILRIKKRSYMLPLSAINRPMGRLHQMNAINSRFSNDLPYPVRCSHSHHHQQNRCYRRYRFAQGQQN